MKGEPRLDPDYEDPTAKCPNCKQQFYYKIDEPVCVSEIHEEYRFQAFKKGYQIDDILFCCGDCVKEWDEENSWEFIQEIDDLKE